MIWAIWYIPPQPQRGCVAQPPALQRLPRRLPMRDASPFRSSAFTRRGGRAEDRLKAELRTNSQGPPLLHMFPRPACGERPVMRWIASSYFVPSPRLRGEG